MKQSAAPAIRAVIAIGALAVVASGCSDDGDTATASITTATTVPVSVDPCEQFTAAMAGSEYTSPERHDGTSPTPELVCYFVHHDPNHSPSIHVVGKPYDAVVADKRLVEREHRTVAGRDVSIGDASEATNLCIISIDIPPGTLQIRVGYTPPAMGPLPGDITTIDQACAEAERVLDIITPVLPDHL
ncbi:DUF3558 domain-containing protein [Aldersonia sp. NBC_00410]|uniref:DUF3558 family protein n=1 Tax=Aldersonia sp. NBC_00410 TaxID=2975954 RepID=UPI002259C05F|nr:DUF3558 family protein [Aldersonia sp. NBC_00410]MCX5042280.1 DUF3558 domain-containing protein [Aldersonia sp. NBC_00410]